MRKLTYVALIIVMGLFLCACRSNADKELETENAELRSQIEELQNQREQEAQEELIKSEAISASETMDIPKAFESPDFREATDAPIDTDFDSDLQKPQASKEQDDGKDNDSMPKSEPSGVPDGNYQVFPVEKWVFKDTSLYIKGDLIQFVNGIDMQTTPVDYEFKLADDWKLMSMQYVESIDDFDFVEEEKNESFYENAEQNAKGGLFNIVIKKNVIIEIQMIS